MNCRLRFSLAINKRLQKCNGVSRITTIFDLLRELLPPHSTKIKEYPVQYRYNNRGTEFPTKAWKQMAVASPCVTSYVAGFWGPMSKL